MKKTKAKILFLLAVLLELIGNFVISYTDGFTDPVPSVICFLIYSFSAFLFGFSLKEINLGIAYAVWSGVGIVFLAIVLIYSCASPGTPDGGPFDETPPRFIGSSPRPGETSSKAKKISMEFDEIVKIEKAAEKVIISPPQLEQAEIKANGKKIQVELFDTLKPNTTN